jgi:hypothetical protein
VPLAAVAVITSLMQFSAMFRLPLPWPRPLVAVYAWLEPFRTFNHYGLFAVMTTSRREIVIQGSNDKVRWLAYEFKYKPGEVRRRPGFVEPHQPRLDWQMWFAALGEAPQNPWFASFCLCLLRGSPPVLGLLQRNPFPRQPPRYIRAVVYEYHFTDFATRRRTGAWWRREDKGLYLPPISMPHQGARLGITSVPAMEEAFPCPSKAVDGLALDIQLRRLAGGLLTKAVGAVNLQRMAVRLAQRRVVAGLVPAGPNIQNGKTRK